jgi:hypothetical protein
MPVSIAARPPAASTPVMKPTTVQTIAAIAVPSGPFVASTMLLIPM